MSTKIINVNSLDDFYNLLDGKQNLLESGTHTKVFRDTMFMAKFGCDCTKEQFTSSATNLYFETKNMDPQLINLLKETLDCDGLSFSWDGEIQFTL